MSIKNMYCIKMAIQILPIKTNVCSFQTSLANNDHAAEEFLWLS